jgi:hypothetical protein
MLVYHIQPLPTREKFYLASVEGERRVFLLVGVNGVPSEISLSRSTKQDKPKGEQSGVKSKACQMNGLWKSFFPKALLKSFRFNYKT